MCEGKRPNTFGLVAYTVVRLEMYKQFVGLCEVACWNVSWQSSWDCEVARQPAEMLHRQVGIDSVVVHDQIPNSL